MICQSLVSEGKLCFESTVEPLISQSLTAPEDSLHRMSALPSPLKSPTPSTVHAVEGPATVAFEATVPVPGVMNQICSCPVERLRKSMSEVPSPLKSPMPTMVHVVGLLPSTTCDAMLPPLMYHTST